MRPVSLAVLLLCAGIGRAAGQPAGPAALTQPDVTADRALTSQTDLVWFEREDRPGWALSERLTLDWSLHRFFVLSGTVPVAYTSFEEGYDPTNEYSGSTIGNPTVLARGRTTFGTEWELTPSLAAGVLIPTHGEVTSTEADKLRRRVMRAQLLHRPYDFVADDPVIPIVASVRLSRGSTTVQATGVVNTLLDDGDPQVAMLQGTVGIAWRAEPIVILGDVGLLAIPPGPHLLGGPPPDAEYLPWLEAGIGWRLGGVDVRGRLYMPVDLPAELGGLSAMGIGFDAFHRFR